MLYLRNERIKESSDKNFSYEFKSVNGKFLFGGKDNVDFKCIIPMHGSITFYDDRNREDLDIKRVGKRIIDKNNNYREMKGKNTTKEFRIMNPKIENNVIRKKITFNQKELRYQYYKNGDIAFCRKRYWNIAAILQPPRVYSDNSECMDINQRIESKGKDMFHVVVINPSWFYKQDKVYFDDPFTITSTATFDAGTKTNVETNTDWPDTIANSGGIPDGEMHLKYGDVYSEGFEGTHDEALVDYDNNWTVNLGGGTGSAKINNEQSYGGNTSLKAISGSAFVEIDRPISWTASDEEFIFYFRCNVTGGAPEVVTLATRDGGSYCAHLEFNATYDIYYYDNGGPNDSTLNYAQDTWYRFRITHDSTAGTYSAWVVGGAFGTENQICNNVNYASGLTGVPDEFYFETSGNTAEYWLDVMKVGDYYTSGNWESAEQTMDSGMNLRDCTFTYDNFSGARYIDKVEWLLNGVVKATYDTNIDDDGDSPLTIRESDLTSGSFNDVNANFTVKLYLVGQASSSPEVEALSGVYHGSNFGVIDCEVRFIGTSTYTNKELFDEIHVESLEISKNSNRSPSCQIQLSATTNAKAIAKGDVVEVIRESNYHCFYGKVEKTSQSLGSQSINISAEGILYYSGFIEIPHKFYTSDDIGLGGSFKNLEVNWLNKGTFTVANNSLNSPISAVEGLHTGEKNFNVKKDTSAPANPTITCDATDPNDFAFPFNGRGGSPASQIKKLAVKWQRPGGGGTGGALRLDICDDNNGVPDLTSIIATITGINDAYLNNIGVTVGGGWVTHTFDDSDFTISDGYNNIDLQKDEKYWLVLRVSSTSGTPIELEWDSGNSAQIDDKWNVRVYSTANAEWHAWLQSVGAGAAYGSYTPVDPQYEFFVGAIPFFEFEFRGDWLPLKYGRDYVIERGSCNVQFGGDKNVSKVDSLAFDNVTRYDSATGKYGIVRMSYSEGDLTLENCFKLIARDFMRDIVSKVDVSLSSVTYELDDWIINNQSVLNILQSLCGVDRVSMRIYKDYDLSTPRVVFEVRDKKISSDYSSYGTSEQNFRTFKSSLDCAGDPREIGEYAKISRCSKQYDQHNRINRVTVTGSENIIATRTDWGDSELGEGIIRATTASSNSITTEVDAFDIADKILLDYKTAPFEGDVEIIDGRYDSYKIFTDTNGLVKIIVDELDINDWFEISSITTRWDGGNNWVNTVRISDDSARFKLPNFEGFKKSGAGKLLDSQKNISFYPPPKDFFPGQSRLVSPGGLEPGGVKRPWPKHKSPGSNTEEEDEEAETYEPNAVRVYRDVVDPGGNVFMDIGNSDANIASSSIQGSILNGNRPQCALYEYDNLDYSTYFVVIDKEIAQMSEEDDFPKTIKEVALYDAATGGNPIARAVFAQIGEGTEGYIRDNISNNEVIHHFIKFTSDNRLYIFFDLDKAP